MKRFQFGIKHILIFMCICVLPLGYLSVRLRTYERYKTVIDRLAHLTPDVVWEYEKPVEFHSNVTFDNLLFRHKDFEVIGELDSLRAVSIMNAPTLSEKDFVELRSLRNLRMLRLLSTPFNDTALSKLDTLKELRCLEVEGTAITDDGLLALKNYPHLWKVDLSGTAITDKGLRQLAELASLEAVFLGPPYSKGLSADGIQALRDARPDMTVTVGCEPGEPRYKSLLRNKDLDLVLLQIKDPYCPFFLICKLPNGWNTGLKKDRESSDLSVKTILNGVRPTLPTHVQKYFLKHAELTPDAVDIPCSQLRACLRKGVPIEILSGGEEASMREESRRTLQIDDSD